MTNPKLQPKVIAFEGGPCGGKTTIVRALELAMEADDRLCVVLPEVATQHINQLQAAGKLLVDLAKHDRPAFIDFETEVLRSIIGGITNARQRYEGTNTIIAADRIDIATYVSKQEYKQILDRLYREQSPMYTVVDSIVYLPTLARRNPTAYERFVSTNSARYEKTAREAVATCNTNYEAVADHPDVTIYEQTDFTHKMGQVILDVMDRQDEINNSSKLQ